MITDLGGPVWTGREPCVDPANDRDWWSADPEHGRVQAKKDRAHAQQLCQDCPHSSWQQCARKALQGEGVIISSAYGVWAGVWVDSIYNFRKRSEREEAIAQLKAIAATGFTAEDPKLVYRKPKPKPPKPPRIYHGRPRKLDATKIMLARQLHDGGTSFAKIGVRLGCSPATVLRSLKITKEIA
jgi:hypothetical protein